MSTPRTPWNREYLAARTCKEMAEQAVSALRILTNAADTPSVLAPGTDALKAAQIAERRARERFRTVELEHAEQETLFDEGGEPFDPEDYHGGDPASTGRGVAR